MGYNTVAFVLNDLSNELEKSPKTVAFKLAHPPMSVRERKELALLRGINWSLDGEPPLHPQSLEVLPTFHADCEKFFVAGGNRIRELAFLRYGKTKDGKKTVTLVLEE